MGTKTKTKATPKKKPAPKREKPVRSKAEIERNKTLLLANLTGRVAVLETCLRGIADYLNIIDLSA